MGEGAYGFAGAAPGYKQRAVDERTIGEGKDEVATVTELTKLFDEPINESIVKRRPDGFDYVPWKSIVREMNRITGGSLNWSYRVNAAESDEQGFSATANVTVYPDDGPEITKGALGYGQMGFTKSGNPMPKQAATKAERNALTRACALFGPAVGFDLYPDKEDEDGGGFKPAASGGGKVSGERPQVKDPSSKPTESQLDWLGKLGYKGDTSALTRGEASSILDKLFAAKKDNQGKGKARRAARADDDDDDGGMPIGR